MFFSVCSLIATVLITGSEVLRVCNFAEVDDMVPWDLGLNLENFILLIGIALKGISMVPFITFEYYTLLFHHLFVDASHYMGANTSHTFLVHN